MKLTHVLMLTSALKLTHALKSTRALKLTYDLDNTFRLILYNQNSCVDFKRYNLNHFEISLKIISWYALTIFKRWNRFQNSSSFRPSFTNRCLSPLKAYGCPNSPSRDLASINAFRIDFTDLFLSGLLIRFIALNASSQLTVQNGSTNKIAVSFLRIRYSVSFKVFKMYSANDAKFLNFNLKALRCARNFV